MLEVVLQRHAWIAVPVFERLFAAQKRAQPYWTLTQKSEGDLKQRATSTGTQVYPITFKGSVDEALAQHNPKEIRGQQRAKTRRRRESIHSNAERENVTLFRFGEEAVIAQRPTNRGSIKFLEQLRKDNFYCQAFLMGALVNLHNDTFETESSAIVDVCLGGAGGAVAALECGAQQYMGVEYYGETYKRAQVLFEKYLAGRNLQYSKEGKNPHIVYNIKKSRRVHFFRGNGLLDTGDFLKDTDIHDFDVVTDIPWGYRKCPAFSITKVTSPDEMQAFESMVAQQLESLGSPRVTVALNPGAKLKLPEVDRLTTGQPYHVAFYAPGT